MTSTLWVLQHSVVKLQFSRPRDSVVLKGQSRHLAYKMALNALNILDKSLLGLQLNFGGMPSIHFSPLRILMSCWGEFAFLWFYLPLLPLQLLLGNLRVMLNFDYNVACWVLCFHFSICFHSFGCLIQKNGAHSWLLPLPALLSNSLHNKACCSFDHILVLPFPSAGKLWPFALTRKTKIS